MQAKILMASQARLSLSSSRKIALRGSPLPQTSNIPKYLTTVCFSFTLIPYQIDIFYII